MKNILRFLILVSLFFALNNCTKNEIEFYTISGKIVENNTNNGAGNAKLEIRTYKIVPSYNILGGSGYSGSTIEKLLTTTDQNGNFSVLMTKNDDIKGVTIMCVEDGNYEIKIKDFLVKDFQNILVKVDKFETLKIIVKNVNPFNANDKIEFGAPSQYLIKRENFGILNETVIDYYGNTKQINTWIGTNVNSELTYKVQYNFTRPLEIYKTKNGIKSFINTGQDPLIRNQLNTYNIDY